MCIMYRARVLCARLYPKLVAIYAKLKTCKAKT